MKNTIGKIKLHMHEDTMNSIENGKNERPTLDTFFNDLDDHDIRRG